MVAGVVVPGVVAGRVVVGVVEVTTGAVGVVTAGAVGVVAVPGVVDAVSPPHAANAKIKRAINITTNSFFITNSFLCNKQINKYPQDHYNTKK